MQLRQTRKRILHGLTAAAQQGGFRLSASSGGFRRALPGGSQKLSIPFWDYHPEYQFSLTLCIRFEAVEEICNRFADVSPRYYKETHTSITQLEHLGEAGEAGRGVIFRVATEEELDAAIEHAAGLVTEKVLPFFDRYRTLQALDEGMNPVAPPPSDVPGWSSDRRAFDSAFHPRRGMSALVVAHLAGNPRMEALITRHRAEMSSLIPQEREKYENLAAYLLALRE